MTKFKVGDRVICNRPVNTMLEHKGDWATVISITPGGLLELSSPYDDAGFYTAEQFDKFNPVLENK